MRPAHRTHEPSSSDSGDARRHVRPPCPVHWPSARTEHILGRCPLCIWLPSRACHIPVRLSRLVVTAHARWRARRALFFLVHKRCVPFRATSSVWRALRGQTRRATDMAKLATPGVPCHRSGTVCRARRPPVRDHRPITLLWPVVCPPSGRSSSFRCSGGALSSDNGPEETSRRMWTAGTRVHHVWTRSETVETRRWR